MSGIPTTGAVTMTALNTNFSGGNSLSGYRNKTIYDSSTNEATTISGSGAISFSTFRGKRALAPPGAIATAPVISLLTTTGATVTWSVSANATSYVLSIGTSVGASNTYSANVGNVTSAAISNTFLVRTSYLASVYGVNAAGNGTANQNPTEYILCAAPTNVVLTVSSLTSWTITWTAALFATGYSWALSTSSTNASSIYTGTTTGVTTGVQTFSLSSSTLYYAFVYATRTESRSVYGSASFTTPAPPTVTAAVPTASANTITYTWTVSGASSFTVTLYKTTSTAASGGSSVATATTGTSATFTMTASGFYYIIITAVNSIAVQSTATSASALSATYTAPPVATANTPTFSSPAYTQLVNGGTFPATGTRITLINTGTVNWQIINITLGGANKLIDNGITYNDLQISTPPNGSIVFTMPNLATYFEKSVYVEIYNGQGSGIKITNNSGSITYFSYGQSIFSMNTGGPLMTYTWSGTNSPTGYTVNLYASGNGTALATLTNTAATSATYTPVSGTTYFTTVTATNLGGTSPLVQSGNLAFVPPATPTDVAINIYHGNANGGILVSWTAVSGATSYSVTDGTTTTTPTTTSTILPLKNDGSKQLVTVSAVNLYGTGVASASTGISYFPGKSSYYTWVGVGSCRVTLAGAGGSGQALVNGSSGSIGGSGGLISGTFSSSSSTWYIIAGKTGTPSIISAGTGGYGGGGNAVGAGNGGGGCSCISASSTTPLTTMYLCAGGGGGSYGSTNGTSSDTGNSTQNGTGLNGTTSLGGGGGGYFGGLAGNGGGNYAPPANLTGPTTTIDGGGKSNQDGYVIITWGSVTPTLFNPISLTVPMSVWFDASDSSTVTVTGTSPVTAWKSKGCYHANKFALNRNGTTSYITANQNSLNIIRCPADVDMSFSLSAANQARAWFIVAKNTTQQVITSGKLTQYWVVVNQTLGQGQDSPSGPNFIQGNNTASVYLMACGPSGNANIGLNTGQNCPNPYNVWNCYSWVNSATSTANNYIGINKTSRTLSVLNTLASSYRTDTVIYSINTSVYSTGSDVGEIIFYNGEITSTERDNVIAYLMTKWGIT